MKLGTLTLNNCTINTIVYAKKMVVHEYPWSDSNYVTEHGQGVTQVTISLLLNGTTDRDAFEAACHTAGAKKLYFASIVGADDDRYYLVHTATPSITPESATLFRAEVTCFAADPFPYVTATDAHVYG